MTLRVKAKVVLVWMASPVRPFLGSSHYFLDSKRAGISVPQILISFSRALAFLSTLSPLLITFIQPLVFNVRALSLGSPSWCQTSPSWFRSGSVVVHYCRPCYCFQEHLSLWLCIWVTILLIFLHLSLYSWNSHHKAGDYMCLVLFIITSLVTSM